jgi:hypothetical protein
MDLGGAMGMRAPAGNAGAAVDIMSWYVYTFASNPIHLR